MNALEDSYRSIQHKIYSFEGARTLIAVSKGQTVESIAQLYRLGQRDFGESYAQELLEKAAQLQSMGLSEIRWHFIGHLQTNKVKSILPVVSSIHSVDSLKLAEEISKRAAKPTPIFIEINIDAEDSKGGASLDALPELAAKTGALPGISLEGLMCVPKAEATEVELRQSFSKMKQLSQGLGTLTRGFLSMGMSHDFEIALQEGATHVRVGTALFGARAPKKL